MTEEKTGTPVRRMRAGPAVAAGVVVLAGAALAVALTRPAAAASASSSCGGSTPRLTVQGTGQASGPPDALDFTADVSVNAGSAAAALATDNLLTGAVVRSIEGAGVAARDVGTTNLTVNPNYAYTNGQSVITGYGVDNSISVTVRTVADAGSVIDAATAAGGNALNIDSLSFVRNDPRGLEDQARQDAVHQAVTHAAAMARAAGQRLAGVCSLTDQSGVTGPPVPLLHPGYDMSAQAQVPLEGGTQKATAQVTLVYALAPLHG